MVRMHDIDWKAELRKIEREFDGLPPEPSAVEVRAREVATRRAREHPDRQSDQHMVLIGAGARLVLVAALLGALWWWPYDITCGPGVIPFVGALVMVVVGGVWAAVFSWRHRLAMTHAAALLFVLTGLALLAVHVLPRSGYVTITGRPAVHWRCAATPR
jgi:hypothetical protein